MKTDLIIIGAGPIGLCLALSLRNTDIRVVVVDKQSHETLSFFEPDGRDIALTHFSKHILENLDVWSHLPAGCISPIVEAKVFDGNSEYALHFDAKTSHKNTLGYLVSNYALKETIYKESRTANNLTILYDQTVESITPNDQSIIVMLSNGEKIEASLIVAADSRFSKTRALFGIKTHQYNFNQKALVCKMTHEKPHHHIAYECFGYDGTLAVLPLAGNVSSIVITVPLSKSELINAYSEEEFSSYVEKKFKNRLGKMKLMGKRYQYPLVAVYANRFVSHRFALLGDAAVSMHPVTAHGFNLGLKGQHTLAMLIQSAWKNGCDIGSFHLLQKYQTAHHINCKPMYLGTNAIVRLFTTDSCVAKFLRKIVLRTGNNCYPFKKIIVNQLTKI